MRILLTRPRALAEEMAAELRSMGHEVIVSPLLKRQILDIGNRLEAAGALVFTSMNGVAAIGGRIPEALLSRPVFVVGERTAAAATAAGFKNLIVGPGRAGDLMPLIRDFKGELVGPIVHVSGEDMRTDVAALLQVEGFPGERNIAYRMVAEGGLSEEASSALKDGRLDAVLFFSPRSAELFVTLLEAAGLAAAVTGLIAIALSGAVAGPLRKLDWTGIKIAEQPNRAAMYQRLQDEMEGERAGP